MALRSAFKMRSYSAVTAQIRVMPWQFLTSSNGLGYGPIKRNALKTELDLSIGHKPAQLDL